MKLLTASMARHPWITAIFSATFSSLFTCYAFREDWHLGIICLITMLILLFLTLLRQDLRNHALGTLLILSLLSATSQAQQTPPSSNGTQESPIPQQYCTPYLVGIIVIVAGGYVVVKTVKFCQKHFPRPTKHASKGTNELFSASDSSAASFNFSYIGTCPCMISEPSPIPGPEPISIASSHSNAPVTLSSFTLTLREDDNGGTEMIPSFDAIPAEDEVLTKDEFNDELKPFGVYATGECCSEQYAIGGHPVPAAASPIHFDLYTREILIAGHTHRIRVERSFDLETWEPFICASIPLGHTLCIDDASEGQGAFFRCEVSPND